MTERDKLEAMADRLEGVRGTIILHDMDQAAIIAHLDSLIEPIRALAAQQPVAVEPVAYLDHEKKVVGIGEASMGGGFITCKGRAIPDSWIPLYTHPQASAPANGSNGDTSRMVIDGNSRTYIGGGGAGAPAETVIDGYPLWQGIPPAPAADLDALVAELIDMAINSRNYGRSNDGGYFEEAAQAITDLRAQLAEANAAPVGNSPCKRACEHIAYGIQHRNDQARITRLEAENAVAAGDGVLLSEQAALLRECRLALSSLLAQKPMLASMRCGNETLGNLNASLYQHRPQGILGEKA